LKTIHRYIFLSYLTSFLVTLLVVTFVLSIGVIFKASDLLARGVSWQPIVQIFVHGLPQVLAFAIPISALMSCLLIFGRLSADGEITAMKACGVSPWQISVTPLATAIVLSLVCLFLHQELAPRSHWARGNIRRSLGAVSPLALIEEGRFIKELEGITLYVGRRKGNNLRDIKIYDLRKPGVRREIRAKSGVLRISEDEKDLIVDLSDVRVNPFYDDRPGAMYCKKWSIRMDDVMSRSQGTKRRKDMTMQELRTAIREVPKNFRHWGPEAQKEQRTVYTVEFHKRLSLSVSCFAFVLLGIPLGIKAHRKESSLETMFSLFLAFNFYIFIVVAESFKRRPEMMPHLLVWLPVFIAVGLGLFLIRRGS